MANKTVTADTITDEQIRALRIEKRIDNDTYLTAIWGSWTKQEARARCAELLNHQHERVRGLTEDVANSINDGIDLIVETCACGAKRTWTRHVGEKVATSSEWKNGASGR